MGRQPSVYILASNRNGTLYIGVTSNLTARLHQHRTSDRRGFTARYDVKHVVHFEIFEDMTCARAREKQLKHWRREWKLTLIEQENPDWQDLAVALGFEPIAGD
ncbi:GIY-YIG nuclease family protein [Flavisphingomonas formosensis]|uniref:GIY-YIG nuclease family protein n=1 Tax=Flavisphingomonas formosensis TaxID=861534 RepID=UPI0012FB1EA0|nr:GIY-YIG nuclease family protein [Sphingomonas formosensis]